jgi:hypothetical protein
VGCGERECSGCGDAMQMLAAIKCFLHQWSLVGIMYAREVSFELVADARKVRFNRGWFDEVGHVHGVKAEGFQGGIDWEGVRSAEIEKRIEGGAVGMLGQVVNHEAESY